MVLKPDWATTPLIRFVEQILEFKMLLHIGIHGISQFRSAAYFDTFDASLTKLIKNEVDRGYPLLNAHALIGLGGAFEVMIEDLLVNFLLNDPSFLKNEVFKKVRISLVDFELLEKDERMHLLLGELKKTVGRSHGVNRIEHLLNPFGLSGAVESDVETQILAVHHIRNVLVHRASIADRKLVEGCPWLNLEIGQPVVVNENMFTRFSEAMNAYSLEIIHRVNYKFGIDSRTLA